MTPILGPLRFAPLFKDYLWGGRRLGTLFGKPLPPGPVAESWEVADHNDGCVVVSNGPAAGLSLHELHTRFAEALYGAGQRKERFPLIVKFLDAHQTLSVQVHPNDEQAARQVPPDFGKTEAWVVLHAEPGSVIYAGLKRGFDRQALLRESVRGCCELCLHKLHVQPGDCVFLPAGTVHALGAGIVVAEIQQASNTTYRLFDWNRLSADGQPRPLHLEQAMQVIDFERGPVSLQVPQRLPELGSRWPAGNVREELVRCPYFTLERIQATEPFELPTLNRCQAVLCIEGAVRVDDDPANAPLTTGNTLLLPACMQAAALEPAGRATLLVARLP